MEQSSLTPMDLLKQIAPELCNNQFDQRALLFELPKLRGSIEI